MRLLRLEGREDVSLHEFLGNTIPDYAILSHTWGANREEVTLKDLLEGSGKAKAGYRKIIGCGLQAKKDGLEYFWVDTCCIDKSSSAELSESINSMFEWYRNAHICYVYLADLRPLCDTISLDVPRCRWFTRGWTLQELLAPECVKFFDIDWKDIGTKETLAATLSLSTGIPTNILLGAMKLSNASIASKMSWAAPRETTRVEDLAYCLLGLFEVNMPLIYGEGTRAFRRLQEEIIRHNNDLTIFAWEDPSLVDGRFIGLLARSPKAFAGSARIVPFPDEFANFSITNRGLLLSGDTPLRTAKVTSENGFTETLYLICLGVNLAGEEDLRPVEGGIYLRKIGSKLFCRDGFLPLAGFTKDLLRDNIYDVSETYILLDPKTAIRNAVMSFQIFAIHIPHQEGFRLQQAIPESVWDQSSRVFLRPKRSSWCMYPMVLAMRFRVLVIDHDVQLIVLCDYRENGPVLRMFSPTQYSREAAFIFQQKYQEETMSWEELGFQAPHVLELSDSVAIRVEGSSYHISAGLQQTSVEYIYCESTELGLQRCA